MMNNNFFENVEISNFKSIEKVDFKCKRINVFIGKPNVGKSCIIEALSLLTNPNLLSEYDLKQLIRFESFQNLFHNNIIHNDIVIRTDKSLAYINYDIQFNYLISNYTKLLEDSNNYLFTTFKNIEELYNNFSRIYGNPDSFLNIPFISSNFKKYQIIDKKENNNTGFTYPYKFNPKPNYPKIDNLILKIPDGDNLFWVLSQNELIEEEFANYLKEYNLELVYVQNENKYLVQKKMNRNRVVQIPYSMIADTLQRIIFYTAAIYSNKNSILLFEEPEVNSFPPYIRELAYKILMSKTNQFFITTHSPYLLTTLLEDSGNEVMLNIVGYKDGKTVIRQVSLDEIKELLSYDSDIFLNIDRYII